VHPGFQHKLQIHIEVVQLDFRLPCIVDFHVVRVGKAELGSEVLFEFFSLDLDRAHDAVPLDKIRQTQLDLPELSVQIVLLGKGLLLKVAVVDEVVN